MKISATGTCTAKGTTGPAIMDVEYRMLTLTSQFRAACSAGEYQVEYEPLNVAEYEKRYEEQQIIHIKKEVANLGFQKEDIEKLD